MVLMIGGHDETDVVKLEANEALDFNRSIPAIPLP
jgi:hypothetical protein